MPQHAVVLKGRDFALELATYPDANQARGYASIAGASARVALIRAKALKPGVTVGDLVGVEVVTTEAGATLAAETIATFNGGRP